MVRAPIPVAIAVALASCLEEGGGTLPDGGAPPDGGAQPDRGCQTGELCRCEDGRNGLTTCVASAPCDCSACSPLTPDVTPEFSACGGEPFGSWELESADFSMPSIDLFYLQDNIAVYKVASCWAETEEVAPNGARLVLEDGGTARFWFPLVSIERRIDPTAGCVFTGLTCPEVYASSNASRCVNVDCGQCTCTSTSGIGQFEAGFWSRTGSTLAVGATSTAMNIRVDYCVTGDRLVLHAISAHYVLKRAEFSGVPDACAARSATNCTSSAACRLGECVGAGDCTGATAEANCTNRQGCNWDTSRCAGTAPARCALPDYGVVPGCAVSDPVAPCASMSGC